MEAATEKSRTFVDDIMARSKLLLDVLKLIVISLMLKKDCAS
jgi:hypothetical protein